MRKTQNKSKSKLFTRTQQQQQQQQSFESTNSSQENNMSFFSNSSKSKRPNTAGPRFSGNHKKTNVKKRAKRSQQVFSSWMDSSNFDELSVLQLQQDDSSSAQSGKIKPIYVHTEDLHKTIQFPHELYESIASTSQMANTRKSNHFNTNQQLTNVNSQEYTQSFIATNLSQSGMDDDTKRASSQLFYKRMNSTRNSSANPSTLLRPHTSKSAKRRRPKKAAKIMNTLHDPASQMAELEKFERGINKKKVQIIKNV